MGERSRSEARKSEADKAGSDKELELLWLVCLSGLSSGL